ATRRRQEAMNKAYAHVVTDDFGKAAGELTQSLINIGFNPMEAATAIHKDRPETAKLPLEGGESTPPPLPTTRIEVAKAPKLDEVPDRDRRRVVCTANEGGKGGSVEITDEIDTATVEAIVLTAPPGKRDELA